MPNWVTVEYVNPSIATAPGVHKDKVSAAARERLYCHADHCRLFHTASPLYRTQNFATRLTIVLLAAGYMQLTDTVVHHSVHNTATLLTTRTVILPTAGKSSVLDRCLDEE